MPRDWLAWHDAYDRPDGWLSDRLGVVRSAVGGRLESAPPGSIRVLSLCAGDGRDVLPVAAGHARRADVRGRLVELDPVLADRARSAAGPAGLAVEVVTGDAADPANLVDAVPADLVLLCGIFGNIVPSDVHSTVSALPMLCATGAIVVWTRHRRSPDLTPSIRRWCADVGCRELAFESAGAGAWSVGVAQYLREPAVLDLAGRLFVFRDDLW